MRFKPTWPKGKCIHGAGSGAGIHKDDPGKGTLFVEAFNKATEATKQYAENIVADLKTSPNAIADKAICGLLGVDPKNCAAVDFYVQFNSRGTYIAEIGMPSHFPAVLPPKTIELAAYGLAAGDVIELRSVGAYRHGGYWGSLDLTYGSTAVFFNSASYLARASLTPADPGSAPPAPATITGDCPDNAAQDNPCDFGITHAAFRRVKVPAGGTHMALSVPDCFHGDNIGTMTVNIRRVP